MLIIFLSFTMSGCSKEGQGNEGVSKNDQSYLPAFNIESGAPELIAVHPRLTSGALSHAKLMKLSEGVLIRTEKLIFTRNDIDAELNKMPPEQKDLYSKNQFLIADQLATGAILEQEAKAEMSGKGMDVSAMDQNMLLQTWIGGKVSDITVTEEETKKFYEENKDLIGGAPYEQVKGQINSYLAQEKQQDAVQQLVKELGKRIDIAVDADWAKEQDAIGRDNEVDRARDSGKPTMANFGADSCVPCQQMKPIREAVKEKYEGKVNVVYVHADKEQMVSTRYGIRGIPHLIFFDSKGNVFHEQTGVMTEEQIEDLLIKMAVEKI